MSKAAHEIGSVTHGPTRLPSKGACIYCGATGVRLTDEHILPLSLGGGHVIADASCLACANVTKRFEQDVARELWGDARISYNAPSRRKKQRKTHIQSGPLKATLASTATLLDAQEQIPNAPDSLGGKSMTELLADGTVTFNVDPK
jgi:hypothetical protein